MGQMHRILVTGGSGFIGKNLVTRLREKENTEVLLFVRGESVEKLNAQLTNIDAVVHLAGENRPVDLGEYKIVNTDLTHALCESIRLTGRHIPIIFASSIQAIQDNLYGRSKFDAEKIIESFSIQTGNPAAIFRLPGVFGKWSKPNYNSVVTTFCHNIARDLPIKINDPAAMLKLVYIDDVVDEFVRILYDGLTEFRYFEVNPCYEITVGELAEHVLDFRKSREDLISPRVGQGIIRALYSTYISYLPTTEFVYDVPQCIDDRGLFVEMLKTPDCGQISFFTVHPNITRGSHYHHSKTEKFLIVKGKALMRFRNMDSGETFEILVSDKKPQIVDSIPGWVHDITNVGDEEAIVMLWANELFNSERPDCIPCKV